MTNRTTCSYCGGAGGDAENLNHNVRCPRFGGSESEIRTDGLNALRDGTTNPAAPASTPSAREAWIEEDRRIRERLAQEGR